MADMKLPIKIWTAGLFAFFAVAFGFQFFALPILLRTNVNWAWAIVPFFFTNYTLWALIHEAVHGHLLANKRANAWAGRTLSLFFGSPFVPLRVGHLLHHRFNRGPHDKTEFFVESETSRPMALASYYFYLLGGLYFIELLVPVLSILPMSFVRRAIFPKLDPDSITYTLARSLTSERNLSELRRDAVMVWVLYGVSVWLYAGRLWVFGLILLARGLVISFLDNAYHYDAADRHDPAQGYDLKLPRWAAFLILNFNYHGLHHRNTTLRWWDLPRTFATSLAHYDGPFGNVAWKQMSGPKFRPRAESNSAAESPSNFEGLLA